MSTNILGGCYTIQRPVQQAIFLANFIRLGYPTARGRTKTRVLVNLSSETPPKRAPGPQI